MTLKSTSGSLRFHQTLGLFLIVLLVAVFGGWAALASISGAVIGQARVVVESSAKKIQHVEGGIVSELLIRDGSRVCEGDLLLRLDQTETRANLAIIDSRLDELRTRQARLEAERDQADKIIFPKVILERLSDPRVNVAYHGQKNLFLARREAKQGEQAQLKFKVEQLEEEIRGLTAQQNAKEKQLFLIRHELKNLQGLKDRGLVTQNRILALEREEAKLDGERGEIIAGIARKRGEIGETRLRIIQIDKNLSSEIIAELRDTQTKLTELLEKRLAAEIRLTRTEIRAPRSGFVHQLSVHTVGGVIQAGETIMLIVPEQDKLVFEARIPPDDIDQLWIGQEAMIRLHAFDIAVTPELEGKVTLISADAIIDQQTGAEYYLARIGISQKELGKLKKGQALVPGMLAEAFIETAPRTVLSYLVKPLSDRLAHALRER